MEIVLFCIVVNTAICAWKLIDIKLINTKILKELQKQNKKNEGKTIKPIQQSTPADNGEAL